MKIRLKEILYTAVFCLLLLGGFQYKAIAQYASSFWYPHTCNSGSGTCLTPVDSNWGIDVKSVNVSTGEVISGHTDLKNTSNSTSTLTVVNYGTGDNLAVYDGGSKVFAVLDGGTLRLQSGDTIKNTSASSTAVSGYFGVGTSTPKSVLSVSTRIQQPASTKLFTVASTTGATLFQVTADGIVHLGKGGSVTNFVQYDTTSGNVNLLSGLNTGAWSAPADSGTNVPLYDMPITAGQTAGTPNSYFLRIDGNNVLGVYGESDGSGGSQNRRVAIGTSTPKSMLSVSTNSAQPASTKLFTVASTTGAELFKVQADGVVAAKSLTSATYGNVVTWDATTGQFGQAVSSERFKKDIRPLEVDSNCIENIKVMSFEYNGVNGTTEGQTDFNPIAEKVEKACPSAMVNGKSLLITYDAQGKPYGLRSMNISMLLLDYVQKHQLGGQTPATGQKQGYGGYILGGLALIISLISLKKRYA